MCNKFQLFRLHMYEGRYCIISSLTLSMKTTKSKRGFAAMSKEKRQAIARAGGKASHGGGRKSSSSRSKSR